MNQEGRTQKGRIAGSSRGVPGSVLNDALQAIQLVVLMIIST